MPPPKAGLPCWWFWKGTDIGSEIDSSARLGSREGALRSIQSTKCNSRVTWAASFNAFI